MNFNSLNYLIFFGLFALLFWSINNKSYKNLLIILGSYIFYSFWNFYFLSIIIFSTLFNYYASKLIYHKKNKSDSNTLLIISICVNLSILFVFKYYSFFTESLLALFGENDRKYFNIRTNIILPLGISFFTFQVVGYLIDVKKGKISPCNNILPFASYVSFFPQLIAGPIEKAKSLIPQFENFRKFSNYNATIGCRLILLGLFKKVAIADQCSVHVNRIFGTSPESSSSGILLIGVVLFAIQIYCDFSGYCDIAIGCGFILGIKLSENFNLPYFSTTIQNFWKKWHITLSRWFKEYVYIPLGGSRKGSFRTTINIILTFLISGLWHGANFTFIVWGLIHAVAIILQIKVQSLFKSKNRITTIILDLAILTSTIYTILIGWIFFRSPCLASSLEYILYLHTNLSINYPIGRSLNDVLFFATNNVYFTTLILIIFIFSILSKKLKFKFHLHHHPRFISWPLYLLMIISIMANSLNNTHFIYFIF